MPDARPAAPPAADDTLSIVGDPDATAARPDLGSAFTPAPGEPDADLTRARPVSPDTSDDLPARVGRYEIVGELARGGMGVVCRATDPAFGRAVAVKLIARELRDHPPSVARFLDEARVTARLQHPAIPPVHDIGDEAGVPFLVMKLIDGDTLDALLKARPDPAHDRPRFLTAFEGICQALAFAHSNGFIHRDLKPANVMVGGFGEVQVMDWGLAKQVRNAERGTRNEGNPNEPSTPHSEFPTPHSDLTQYGQAVGTPSCMPPEQARGELDRVDRRSDVFGLGAILSVILTGRPPFVGRNSKDVLTKAASGELTEAFFRLDSCDADPDLIALAKRCLAADPAARFANAGELAAAVVGWREAAEERARKAEVGWQRAAVYAREKAARARMVRAFVTVGALTVGALVAGYFIDDARRRAMAAETDAKAAQEEARLRGETEKARGIAPGAIAALAARTAYRFVERGELAEADAILRDAGSEIGADAPAEAKAQLKAALRDVAFARRVEEIQTTFLEPADDPANALAARYADFYRTEYTKLFAEHGFDPRGAEAADRLTASPIRTHFARALDHWTFTEPDADARRGLRATALVLQGRPRDARPKVTWTDTADLKRLWSETTAEHRTPALCAFVLVGVQRFGGSAAEVKLDAEAAYPNSLPLAFQRGLGTFLTAKRGVEVWPKPLPEDERTFGQIGPPASLHDARTLFRACAALRPTHLGSLLAERECAYRTNGPDLYGLDQRIAELRRQFAKQP